MHSTMLRIGRVLGMGSLLLACFAASAEKPGGTSGARWDDQHMLSNFAHREIEPSAPSISSVDRTETVATHVEERLLSLNPHPWQRGALSMGAKTSWSEPAPGADFSASDGARLHRSSSIRGSAISSGQRDRVTRR